MLDRSPCPRFLCALLVLLLASAAAWLLPGAAQAKFWEKRDWKNGNHKLSVCVKDASSCPAGMVDSVKAAIKVWNDLNITWKFTYETDCSKAQVTIACADLGTETLGQCGHDKGLESANNESATITINTNPAANFGWCNDKHELVSTIAHELGHTARLRDLADGDQSKLMRGEQGLPGHARGASSSDSAEAATSDTAKVVTVKTNPPSVEKQTPYTGVITPAAGTAPLDLGRAIGLELRAYQPGYLEVTEYHALDPEAVGWSALPHVDTADMQLFHLVITYPESVSVREGLLHVTNVPILPSMVPAVVAPEDTVVPDNHSAILLDPRRSGHPMGPAVMSYAWVLDDGSCIEGMPVARITLPQGIHTVRLVGMDDAGNVAEDAMTITVLFNVGVEGGGDGGGDDFGLLFSSPVRRDGSVSIAYELPRAGMGELKVYDLQGRAVATLVSRPLPAGRRTVGWDLRGADGARVSSGVYYVALRLDDRLRSRKLVVIQ